jgi:hypothetical protein
MCGVDMEQMANQSKGRHTVERKMLVPDPGVMYQTDEHWHKMIGAAQITKSCATGRLDDTMTRTMIQLDMQNTIEHYMPEIITMIHTCRRSTILMLTTHIMPT